MKLFNRMILCLCALLMLSSCDDDNNDEKKTLAKRTVLIYMCAENNLDEYGYFNNNMRDIETGSKSLPDDVNLIVFVDRQSKIERPYIARCSKDGVTKLKVYDEDFYSVDINRMKEVMSWVSHEYPAESYGLSLWGHANGWIPVSERYVVATAGAKVSYKAYGADSGADNTGGSEGYKYINIPELNEAISSSFPRLDFIFFDCCQSMCAELVYELRNSARYIIGSPAEIPGRGAPYVYVVPDFFLEKEKVGPAIVNHYIEKWMKDKENTSSHGLPLAVVDEDRMGDFAHATAQALGTFMNDCQYPDQLDMKGVIYYGKTTYSAGCPCFYDINDIMQRNLSEEDYKAWHEVMKQTVVYSTFPGDYMQQGMKNWLSVEGISFSSFDITDTTYGGLSMFVPQTYYQFVSAGYLNPNVSIFSMKWTDIVDWSKWGWTR